MKCAGCSNEATHLVEVAKGTYQEHCKECMLDALCSEPVRVIDLDAYNHKLVMEELKKEAFERGQLSLSL